ncbi:hypothetical protein JST97_05720 [bacterium]|nr:hypothetical protein [bacterium]
MNVSSKPTSSSGSHKTSSSTKTKSSSSVKSATSKPASKPASQVQKPKDSVSLSRDLGVKANGNVPNFGSWAMAAPQAPQVGAKPAPSDPAPRVAPAPAAPAAPPEPRVGEKPVATAPSGPPLPGKEVGDHPAPNSKAGLAKNFDDAGWATAQARHTAEVAEKAGGALKAQQVASVGSSALRPLNPAASVMGGVAFGKMAYDSAKAGNYGEAALQAGNSAALTTLAGAGLKGTEVATKVAGRAAPALGGALQAYEGFKKGDTFDTVSGGAKIAGAAMIATGFGAPVGSALILGSYMADLGRWGYQKLTQ